MVFELPSIQFEPSPASIHDDFRVTAHISWPDVDSAVQDLIVEHTPLFGWDVQDQVESGGTLWVGSVGGAAASMAVSRRGEMIGRYFFPLDNGCIVLSHCMTFPQFRHRGFYTAMLRQIVAQLGQTGERLFIDCADYHVASVRGIGQAGFHRIGTGTLWRSGRLSWKPLHRERE